MADQPTAEERQRRYKEAREKAIAAFPFEPLETTGELALSTWQQLKGAGRGFPVVQGGDHSLGFFLDALDYPKRRTAAEILAAATSMRHPEALIARQAQDKARVREYLEAQRSDLPSVGFGAPRQNTQEEARALQALMQKAIERMGGLRPPATLGSRGEAAPGLSVASDSVTGKPLPKVHIVLVPTDDWTTLPAHLNWGGWNDCPHPEYHIAALRSWRERFGVELVGLSHNTMNLTVTRRPETAEAAMDLAREQYIYCSYIVHGGTQTLDRLAKTLMTDEWWYFRWH